MVMGMRGWEKTAAKILYVTNGRQLCSLLNGEMSQSSLLNMPQNYPTNNAEKPFPSVPVRGMFDTDRS